MKVAYKHFPPDIREMYKLDQLVMKDGYIDVKIKKGMYGLKQAAILAYERLKVTLQQFGYHPVIGTVGLWKHMTRPIQFCLCVDDFGVKYYNRKDVVQLLQAIGKLYKYTTDWTGTKYCGMTFDWDYDNKYVDVSMPGYV